ncbi:hypothetical protein A6V18_21065 [Escherichia coli]|nr:hypothetical protein A6V18_21065 [Escherichia coli]
MLPSETMIWQPEFTDKTLSRKPGAVHIRLMACPVNMQRNPLKNGRNGFAKEAASDWTCSNPRHVLWQSHVLVR